jgi:hypothetical protein
VHGARHPHRAFGGRRGKQYECGGWVDYLVKPVVQTGVRKVFGAAYDWVGAHWHESVAWIGSHWHESVAWIGSHWHEVMAWIIQLVAGGGSNEP